MTGPTGTRRRPAVAALAAALVLAAAAAEQAAAQEFAWRAYAREMAEPWPAIQRDTGNLPDYLDGLNNPYEGTRYGDAMMGWAMLQTGLRESDDRLIGSGLRAIDYATNEERKMGRPSVFETMAVASAYNLVRGPLADDRRFQRLRPQWERWLRRVRTERLQYVNRYGNHWLVDAISVLELLRSGLVSQRRRAVLGGGRTTARRQAIRLINIRVPRLLDRGGPFVLSDPPDQPLAYHGLSIAFYARAIRLMGQRTAPRARTALRRAVRASQLLAAPDGAVSYFGRSQEEVWTLPATAYGAQVATLLPGSSPALERASEALAERALERLRRHYAITERGSWVTPALTEDVIAGARGLDAYAGAPSYAGLALVWLNFTIDEHPEDPLRGDLPADHLFATTLSQGNGRFAVVRRSRFWFAVKMTRSSDPHYVDDLRYDFGLAIVKQLVDGRWRDLVPERPRGVGGRHDSAGPALLNASDAPAYPFGSRISASRSGIVRISGGFRTPGGRVVRRVRFFYRPTACGVRLSFAARAGDLYGMSAFFRGGHRPRIEGNSATAGGQQVRAFPPPDFGAAVDGGASGMDARLMRQRMFIRATENRSVRVAYCVPRGPAA